jgi:hypothetical protein
MQFKASFYATPYFGHFLTVMFAVFLIDFLFLRHYLLALGLLTAVAGAVVRLRARRMSFSEMSFHYDGWFRSLAVPYSEISKVENSSKLGYPHNRLHGPNEYRLTAYSGMSYWISLLWFESEAAREFHKRIVKRDRV